MNFDAWLWSIMGLMGIWRLPDVMLASITSGYTVM